MKSLERSEPRVPRAGRLVPLCSAVQFEVKDGKDHISSIMVFSVPYVNLA